VLEGVHRWRTVTKNSLSVGDSGWVNRLRVGGHVFDERKSMYVPTAAIISCFFVLMRRYCISFCDEKKEESSGVRQREWVDYPRTH
jgi:hypothetical protein